MITFSYICANCLGLVSPPFLSLVLLFCIYLPFLFLDIISFPLSVPVPWAGNGTGEAESITVPANTPSHAHSPVSDSLPARPAAIVPPFPLQPTHTSKSLGVLFGCSFSELTIIYILAVVETLVQIHHNFPFSNFTKIAIITFSQ